ncbi:MAG: UUP1 family membrane protein, partial [Candidatus Binatia bacterium]
MKHPAVLLAGILLLIPATLVTYRILWLKYPLSLRVPGNAWQITMQAEVQADRHGIQVEIGLPFSDAHQKVVSEQISSGGLDFDLIRDRPNRIGIWSAVEVSGAYITYRATILESPRRPAIRETPRLGGYPPKVQSGTQALAERLAARWLDLPPPARFLALSTAVSSDWRITFQDKRDLREWLSVEKKHGKVTAFLILLRAAALPARAVEGLQLVDSVRTEPLRWVEVWTGNEWKRLVLVAGVIDPKSTSLLPLATGLPAVLQSAGKLLEVRWNITQRKISSWFLHFDRIRRSNRWLDRWSLFHLPRDFQDTFRILLLVPISALLIGVFRNVVGFPTFGIFMPVLMALAFRNTGLLYGLGIFT